MAGELVKTKQEESALIITLDNPPVNALSFKMLEELQQAVGAASNSPDIRGIVITGAGTNAFCAGADLKIMQNVKPEDAPRIVGLGQQAFSSLEDSPKPVIAAVNGIAIGAGNELAMACDLRIVSDRARFGQSEVNLGLIPAWGGTQRLSRLVGKAKSKELIFSGQMISAQEAYRIGLVNKVVPDGEEVRASVDYIRMLAAKCSPLAVSQAKYAIDKGLQASSLKEGLAYEVEAIKVLSQSEDLKEGMTAFLEKRHPRFTGK